MIGQLSSLVGDEVGTRVYGLLNRVQMWRICAVFFSGFSSSCVCSARYGATVARLLPIFLFFPCRSLVGEGSPGGRKGDMVQLWRICAVFFSGSLPPA